MKAYKMMRKKNGKLYPLYVDANNPLPIGEWIEAQEGERTASGKVKSKLGELHYRPGFHLCADAPYETHIGVKDADGNIVALRKDIVWCEVEYSTNINYQDEANANGINKNGKFVARDADLDHIPVDGYYRYKTNPKMYGEWIIAGAMKIIRELTDEEVIDICSQYGLVPLPRAI